MFFARLFLFGRRMTIKFEDIPDEYLEAMMHEFPAVDMSVPWQYDVGTGTTRGTDADGFSSTPSTDKSDDSFTREILQEQCWLKFQRTPQVNTALRGMGGRMAGEGFETSSDIPEIQDAIEEIELDPRNRLYNFWPKYVVRSLIEGELRLCATVHDDGFIEIDFIDPACVRSSEEESGIIYHPNKTTMPLIYCIKDDDKNINEQIPSIFIARYPELITVAKDQRGFSSKALRNSRSRKKKFASIGGFKRFIIEWDKSYITKRNVSYVRTTLEWLNHYENLKKYEIDHKKSAGAYVWAFQFKDIRSWIEWMRMSDSDRAKTGISIPKTPGGSLVLGPNMEVKVLNPNLPNISDSDTDILHQITSGLNEPEDVSTGQSKGTFASVKASRGPFSDRTSDEVSYFEKFLRHDFWSGVFFLKSAVSSFPKLFEIEKAISFKNKKVKFKKLKRRPELEPLLDITFPTSEVGDIESLARAFFGAKHASLHDTAAVPLETLVKKMGLGNSRKLRLQYETEKKLYPELPLNMDAESMQEKLQAEPARPGEPKKPEKEKPSGKDEPKPTGK